MPTPSKYWREIPQRFRFEAGKCARCGYLAFPPRLVCPQCGHREFAPHKLAETGKLLTYTVVRVAPGGFEDEAPYAVGIAQLADGVKLTAQVADCEFADLKVGMDVRLEFRKMSEDGAAGVISYGYKFVPA
ncbi:MAG: Zn-ribbon domain-containing OB-fold protein [Candidatus Aminicenantes bacterium]|nr:Zn-ribbon domain-containing OB-fold protein [Candidatus Aminicenantes bacterium]